MGVGGCGSSFIWSLLGDCGHDTKGINEWMRHSGVRAALKAGTLDQVEYPKVIKHLGGFLNNLNKHIDDHGWEVEHIFFVVASYEYQIRKIAKRRGVSCTEPISRAKVEKDYRNALGTGLIQLIERDHPFTMVRLPRSIKDPRYCYDRLKVVLGEMTYEEFEKIHAAQIIPERLRKLDNWE
jgi:hypothetical protein